MTLVGQAADARDGIRQYRQYEPDVTLMDLRLPDMSGIDALIAIRAEFPRARVLILSTFQGDVEIQRSLKAGARGFLVKSMRPADLVTAIRDVHLGKTSLPPEVATTLASHVADDTLTAREIEILQLVAAGHRNKDVAHVLSIQEDTVKFHVRNVMDKLGARDRTEAVVIGVQRGIIQV